MVNGARFGRTFVLPPPPLCGARAPTREADGRFAAGFYLSCGCSPQPRSGLEDSREAHQADSPPKRDCDIIKMTERLPG